MPGRWRQLWVAGLLAVLPVKCGGQRLCGPSARRPASANVRPEVKSLIDRMAGYSPAGSVQTTDSTSSPAASKRLPENPKPFPASTFKIVFEGEQDVKVLWIGTEDRVGHFATVTPGATDIGGSVRLSSDVRAETPDGPLLNDEEIDYLLAKVYSKFCKPLDQASAARLNQIKDMVLAVRFSGKTGMNAYHRQLLSDLK